MEKTLKDQLYSLYSTYSAIDTHFKRIESEAARLEEERKTIIKLIEKNNEFRYKIEQLKSQLPNRDTKNGRFTSKKK